MNDIIGKLTSGKIRTFQTLSVLIFGGVSVLAVFVSAGWLSFLVMLALAFVVLMGVGPVLASVFDADTSPLPRAARTTLRAAEGAGFAGLALVLVLVLSALTQLFGAEAGQQVLTIGVILVLMAHALILTGIGVSVGLSNLLRATGIEIEAPPAAAPKPVAAVAPAAAPPGAAPPQAAQQWAQQPQQGYQQPQQPPPGGYDPNQGGQS